MQLYLDRLSLRVSGLSPSDGRRLVELVGERLAQAAPPADGGQAHGLRVSIAAGAADTLDALAQRIVDEMLRSFARSQS